MEEFDDNNPLNDEDVDTSPEKDDTTDIANHMSTSCFRFTSEDNQHRNTRQFDYNSQVLNCIASVFGDFIH
jgi:hypothetical protein